MNHFSKKVFEGKTIEEAIEKAERELGIPKDKFIYDIVREKGGILGFGQKVVIEVHPRPADVEEDDPAQNETVQKVVASSNGNVTKRLTEFFEGVLERLGESGKIEVTEEEKKYVVRAAISEGSIFLNRKGHTIDSIKYLLNLVAIREGGGNKRISIFIAEKPADSDLDLVEMAKEVKEKVEKSHRSIAIGGMDSKARKVFHSAIGHERGISTHSEGSGVQRKLYVEKGVRGRRNYRTQSVKRVSRGGKRYE